MSDKKPAKKEAAHPPYAEMVAAAVGALKERTGSSRHAIKKYVKGNYAVKDNADIHINKALKSMLAKESLVQAKGCYKLPKKAKEAAKKPAAKKPKAAAAKKTVKKTAAKKPAAKKAASKKVKKSPKKAATKAKKPVAKKSAKKPAKKSTKAKK